MTATPTPFDELHELAGGMVDGSITSDQFARLCDLLSSDREAQRFFVRYVDLHASILRSIAGNGPTSLPSAASEAAGFTRVASVSMPTEKPETRQSRLRNASWLVGLTASLLLVGYFAAVAGLLFWDRFHRANHDPDVVVQQSVEASAQLARADDASWVEPAHNAAGQRRTLRVRTGLAELSFAKGATVIVEGPAEFEVRSSSGGYLRRGKLVARVPRRASGFTVETDAVNVVDLGTEFGVRVDESKETAVVVFRGEVELKHETVAGEKTPVSVRLVAGEAIQVTRGSLASAVISDARQLEPVFSSIATPAKTTPKPTTSKSKPVSTIWLGNLFDDPPGTSLSDAMRTDSFKATASPNVLGIYRVEYGGNPVINLGRNLMFDFENLGWLAGWVEHRVVNDAWTASQFGPVGGIRLNGSPMSQQEPKIDEGIGMHSNSLLCFELDEIRTAGNLHGRKMEFVCDRAGINDGYLSPENARGHIYMVALVSTETEVRTALVNGKSAKAVRESGRWLFTAPVGEPLGPDGRTVSFRAPVPADARYLTLVSASADDGLGGDHAVWIGARLLVTENPETQRGSSN